MNLRVCTNRTGSPCGVDRGCITIEDLAYLLTGKRFHAALMEGPVRSTVGGKSEFASNVIHDIVAHAVLRESAYESLLDSNRLFVGDRFYVLAPQMDMVIHLGKGLLTGEFHLSCVVLAG